MRRLLATQKLDFWRDRVCWGGMAFGIIFVLLLSGCASISVEPEKGLVNPSPSRTPQQLLVEAFTFPAESSVRVDRSGIQLADFKTNLQKNLRAALVQELEPFGVPVRPVTENEDSSSSEEAAWLIRGQFIRVNQGSRLLRIGIGLGAGGTKMETAVQIHDLAAKSKFPLFAFRTTGGSNAEPGLLVSGGPVTGPVGIAITVSDLGITAVTSGSHGVSEDTRRTARVIASYLSEKLAAQGIIPTVKARKAKRLQRQ